MVAGDRELATMASMTAMTVDKSPSKRPCHAISNEPSPRGPGGSGGADQSKSSSSTEDIKAIVSNAFAAEKTSLQNSLLHAIEGHVETIIVKSSGQTSERLSNLETGIHRLEKNQEQQAKEFTDFKKEVLDKLDVITSGFGGSPAAPNMSGEGNGSFPAESPLTGFNRDVNLSTLFCNTDNQIKVARSKFHESVVKLAAEAGLADDTFNVVGDPLDNRFEIFWNGDPRTARDRCSHFFQSLQLGRGKWKPQVVLDDQSQEVKFYVGPDKNPCQVRREVLAKSLKDLVSKAIPDVNIFIKKSAGTLYIDKRPLVTVHISGPESARLTWNPDKVASYKLDLPRLEEGFRKLVRGELSS